MLENDLPDGLNDEQVTAQRIAHGVNGLDFAKENLLLLQLKAVVLEPMFLLLLTAAIFYFIAGSFQEGLIMTIAIFLVAGISIFQSYRSKHAVEALKKFSDAKVSVRRNGKNFLIAIEEIVVDDILFLEEGDLIAADGKLLSSNDFSVNESVLTGESLPVFKTSLEDTNLFRGTLIISGSAIMQVTAVGLQTSIGKIGKSIETIKPVKTPLEIQVHHFVMRMVWIGTAAFIAVVAIHYFNDYQFGAALIQGLTLAMSILPEEIPVAFSSFQALGAYRLIKKGIIVKEPRQVETLGAATVICADKTGTLTQNKMAVCDLYDVASSQAIVVEAGTVIPQKLISYAMWASETTPFDPMEIAIHQLYEKSETHNQRSDYKQVHEYPISGKPPMMTHIFSNAKGENIIAAKGALEAILKCSTLNEAERMQLVVQGDIYARQGLRVLAVAEGIFSGDAWPATQDSFKFNVLGLVVFQDPPKDNIIGTLASFKTAGIGVKMITGDHPQTAIAIAKQIKLDESQHVVTGADVMNSNDTDLQLLVKDSNLFARMFPEAKLRVIEALKRNGEIVAMTGDGVNDAPALKAAHIGIAMGKRGSEVARESAALILVDDDLAHMTDAVAIGRQIYDNLKKAIRYIVSIHIPIIGIVLIPLLLGWDFTAIFTPVHVIFLELIMGPTCSIVFENEPMEPGTMQRPPRKMSTTFFSGKQLIISFVQGILITTGCLALGYFHLQAGYPETVVRSMVFICLLFSNIFLTLVNRSFQYPISKTIFYKNKLVPIVIGITLLLIIAMLYVPFLRSLFSLEQLPLNLLLKSLLVAFLSTCWIQLLILFNPGKHNA